MPPFDVSIISMLIPMDAGWIWSIPCLHDLTKKIWKEWEAHRSWEVMPERDRSSGLLRATPPFRASTVGLYNLQQLYIHGADKLIRLRNILSAFISPPWASRALPAGSEDVRDNTSSSSSLLSSAAVEREILIPPADSSASSICDPHDLSLLTASAAAGPEPRGADDCPNSLEKRDIRERSFPREKSSQCTHSILSRTERACSSPKHITHKSDVSSGVRKHWHGSTHLLRRFSTDIITHTSETKSPEDKKRMTCSTGALLCPQTLICLLHRLPPANVKCIVCFYSCFRDQSEGVPIAPSRGRSVEVPFGREHVSTKNYKTSNIYIHIYTYLFIIYF